MIIPRFPRIVQFPFYLACIAFPNGKNGYPALTLNTRHFRQDKLR